MCPALHPPLVMAATNHLRCIHHFQYLPISCTCSISLVRDHTVNMMASHHTVEFINAGTGTYCSTLALIIQVSTRTLHTSSFIDQPSRQVVDLSIFTSTALMLCHISQTAINRECSAGRSFAYCIIFFV